ncbi:hypothetical protein G6F55_013156 [Rhizopus delemar]|nr:hypothetical protein G6F55_013156 [Rhizopus delemar]KAG1486710.1 hypothetical protein G6F54_013146 [Rhizopus delemar]
MGGIKTIFFGDVAQLLPIQQKEGQIWESEIFNAVPRYSLHKPVRQQDERFIDILNRVRNYQFDESVIAFINERTVHKSQLPLSCLRLYTTRERVVSANEKDYAEYPGDGTDFLAQDSYVGNERTAKIALRETRLLGQRYYCFGRVYGRREHLFEETVTERERCYLLDSTHQSSSSEY